MTFHVGQKVECINVDPLVLDRVDGRVTRFIKLGGIYRIRWAGECPYEPWREFGLNVRPIGIVRPDNEKPEWSDFPFMASRFRPVVERETDISFAHEILRDVSRKETVRA